MRADRMKVALDQMRDGTFPLREPDMAAAMTLFADLQKDSVKVLVDGKTGDLKSVEAKAYDTTIEEAAKSAVMAVRVAMKEFQEGCQ